MPRPLLPEEVEHGTSKGSSWHKKQGEKPCEPCRIARNEYEKKRRGTNPMVSKMELFRQLEFKNRVLKRMAALHEWDYKAIMREELESMRR